MQQILNTLKKNLELHTSNNREDYNAKLKGHPSTRQPNAVHMHMGIQQSTMDKWLAQSEQFLALLEKWGPLAERFPKLMETVVKTTIQELTKSAETISKEWLAEMDKLTPLVPELIEIAVKTATREIGASAEAISTEWVNYLTDKKNIY